MRDSKEFKVREARRNPNSELYTAGVLDPDGIGPVIELSGKELTVVKLAVEAVASALNKVMR